MKVLVTGANGFIGSHLVPFLEQRGFEVHTLTRKPMDGRFAHVAELTDPKSVAMVCAGVKPDYVIHLASRAVPGRDLGDLQMQIEDTIKPCLVLAQEMPQSVKLALFFGSSDEYGGGIAPFKESQALAPLSPYGWAKVSAYHAVRLILKQSRVPMCWVRPFLVFGPGQRSQALVPSVVHGCLAGESVALSPGEQTRDFLYIDDLCEMILTLLKNPEKASGQTLNLCTSVPRTIKSVAETIQSLCGRGELRFRALPYRENESMAYYGSLEAYERLFGAPKFTPFETALRKTIEAAARTT